MVRVKKSLIFCLAVFIGCTALSLLGPLQAVAQNTPIGLVINGRLVNNLAVPPVMRENRMLVPARAVFEMLGAEVHWNPTNRTVHIQYNNTNIHLTIGETIMFVNTDVVDMPIAAQIINNSTMLPLGVIADNLGFYTAFRDRTVFVYTGDYIPDNGAELEPPVDPPNNGGEHGPTPTPTPTPPAYLQNVSYDFTTRTLRIPRSGGLSLNISQATHLNLYHQHQYILMFTVDASGHFAAGNFTVGDSLLNSINIAHGQHGSQITFNGRQILALDITQNDAYYLVQVMCPRQKYPRIVVIDPGHGGYRPGAVYDDVRAADLNLAVTRKLLQLIEADGFIRAYTTRNADVHVPLADRASLGNAIGDLMITIHHNAAYSLSANGTEAFYITDTHDLSRSLTNQDFAEMVLRNIVARTGRNSRGIRSESFIVLRYTTIPSTLVELGFMSNPQEFERLTNPDYQWLAAMGLYEALLEAFAVYTPAR